MTFVAVLGATVLGSLIGNLAVFWFLGWMAKRVEKQQLKELQKGYLEMVEREKERMENYARMES